MKNRTPAQWAIVGITLSLVAAVAVYRLAHAEGLDQTAALFIGLPAVLAIGVTLTPKARSATGMAMKGLTIGLLLSGVVLNEGLICILMAAPLFYGVALAITVPIDMARRNAAQKNQGKVYGVVLPLVILMSLEGMTPLTSLPTYSAVTASRTVDATATAVVAELAATPRFNRPLPLLLDLPFPHPTDASGSGLQIGDQRTIWFTAGSHRFAVVFEVEERTADQVRFHVVSDQTPIRRWLGWQDATVSWRSAGAGRTTVSWTLTYNRRLSPAWYFGSWEQLANQQAANYLIEVLATPR
jgi:hypothetical protein